MSETQLLSGNSNIVLDDALQRFKQEASRGICDTGRYQMPYYVWGEGPPLVFIHGVSDHSASFIQPISRLAHHFRCIAYDQPGMPNDGSRFSRYRHEHLVADLFALLDHLKVPTAYLFGSSFGSTITLQALRAAPDRLLKAVLQGGLCYRPLRRTEWWLAQMARWFPGQMKHLPLRVKIAQLVNGTAFKSRPEGTWNYFLETSGKTPICTFAHQALMLNKLDLRSVLLEVQQPILLVCGARDTVTGPAHAAMLQKGLPHSVTTIIPDCGHVPSYTHPEVLVEAVRQFLNSAPLGATTASV
jgi:pimeloyl-ACP methyl ester carboxylesterase